MNIQDYMNGYKDAIKDVIPFFPSGMRDDRIFKAELSALITKKVLNLTDEIIKRYRGKV